MRCLVLLPLVFLAGGCAHESGPEPSLALRPAELRGFEEPVRSASPATTPADPALDTAIADAGTRLDALVTGYDADAAAATRAAAAPGARTVGGETWLAAQAALAKLDDWRSQVGALSAELDERARDRAATAGTPYPTLDALVARATAENERETAAIASLSAALPQP